MTSINTTALLPSQAALKIESSMASLGSSFIADLANIKPEQAAALADKTFSALGKDGIKLLPFLTAFVNAFKSGANSQSLAPAVSAGVKVDIATATQKLLEFRNVNSAVKDIDQAIGAISKALPNLMQSDFENLITSLKVATASSQKALTGFEKSKDPADIAAAAVSEVDKIELNLLEGQIEAAVAKTRTSSASSTDNKALDTVLNAIEDIAKDGVTPEEMQSLSEILSATTSALLKPEKASGLLSLLDEVTTAGKALQANSNINAANDSTNPTRSFTGQNSYDPMLTVKNNLFNNAAASDWDPSSTNVQAYNLFLAGNSALTGGLSSGQNFSKSNAANKKPISSVDLS
jgi:hypothetical protein